MDDDELLPGDDPVLAELADRLGVAVPRLLRVVGAGWSRVEPAGAHPPGAVWFAGGRPVQVLLGLAGRTLAVARPVPRPDGALPPVLTARDVEELDVDDVVADPARVTEALDRVVARRRRSFRWCPLCRELRPPEDAHDRHSCVECAVRLRGVVR